MRQLFLSGAFDEAARLYDEAPARSRDHEADILRARIYIKKSPPDAIEPLLRLGKARLQPALKAEVSMLLGMTYALLGQFDESEQHFTQARRHLTQAKRPLDRHAKTLYIELPYRRGRCRLMAGSLDDARDELTELRRQEGERATMLGMHLHSFILGHQGRFKEEAEVLVALLEFLERSKDPDLEFWAWSLYTLAVLSRELYIPDAVGLIERHVASRLWPTDLPIHHYQTIKAIGWCRALNGDYFNAFRFLKNAGDIAPTLAWQAMAAIDRAYLARCINEPRWSRHELADAESLAERVDWRTTFDEERIALILLAELFAAVDPSRAAAYMARYASLGRLHNPLLHFAYDDRLAAMAGYAQGIVQLALGDARGGKRDLKDSLDAFNRVGYDWRAGRCALRLYEATKDEYFLTLAEEKLKHYGSSWLGDELRQLRAPRSANKIQLTPMQERIFGLVCAGKSTNEISRILNRSPFTVRNHLKLIFKAYDVKSRPQLLVEAANRNII